MARNREDNIATRGKDARTPGALPQVLRSPEVRVSPNEKPELSSRFQLRVISIIGFFLYYFASYCRHNEASYNKSQRDALFLNFILVKNSALTSLTDCQHN
jgi:hypothetical protein